MDAHTTEPRLVRQGVPRPLLALREPGRAFTTNCWLVPCAVHPVSIPASTAEKHGVLLRHRAGCPAAEVEELVKLARASDEGLGASRSFVIEAAVCRRYLAASSTTSQPGYPDLRLQTLTSSLAPSLLLMLSGPGSGQPGSDFAVLAKDSPLA